MATADLRGAMLRRLEEPTMDSPTLYLDSWAWVNARKRDGTWPLDRSGRVFTIMAMTRSTPRSSDG